MPSGKTEVKLIIDNGTVDVTVIFLNKFTKELKYNDFTALPRYSEPTRNDID